MYLSRFSFNPEKKVPQVYVYYPFKKEWKIQGITKTAVINNYNTLKSDPNSNKIENYLSKIEGNTAGIFKRKIDQNLSLEQDEKCMLALFVDTLTQGDATIQLTLDEKTFTCSGEDNITNLKTGGNICDSPLSWRMIDTVAIEFTSEVSVARSCSGDCESVEFEGPDFTERKEIYQIIKYTPQTFVLQTYDNNSDLAFIVFRRI